MAPTTTGPYTVSIYNTGGEFMYPPRSNVSGSRSVNWISPSGHTIRLALIRGLCQNPNDYTLWYLLGRGEMTSKAIDSSLYPDAYQLYGDAAANAYDPGKKQKPMRVGQHEL